MNKNSTVTSIISTYKEGLINNIEKIDTNLIKDVLTILEKVHTVNGKIYTIGNGGSASNASHFVSDLGAGLSRREIRYFNLECLSDNVAVSTALANDLGYEYIFSAQLKGKINENDLLLAYSCSGNSPNIINAVNLAKDNNTTVIGFTGFDGGTLKQLSDINIHIATQDKNYGLVEDMHMILNHMIFNYFLKLNSNKTMVTKRN